MVDRNSPWNYRARPRDTEDRVLWTKLCVQRYLLKLINSGMFNRMFTKRWSSRDAVWFSRKEPEKH